MKAIEKAIKWENENYPTNWEMVMNKKTSIVIDHKKYGVKKETFMKQARGLGFRTKGTGLSGIMLNLK